MRDASPPPQDDVKTLTCLIEFSAGSLRFDRAAVRRPLWRRVLVWFGFKRFARWDVTYTFTHLPSKEIP